MHNSYCINVYTHILQRVQQAWNYTDCDIVWYFYPFQYFTVYEAVEMQSFYSFLTLFLSLIVLIDSDLYLCVCYQLKMLWTGLLCTLGAVMVWIWTNCLILT